MCRGIAECVLSTAGYVFEYCKMCDRALKNMHQSTVEYVQEYCRMCDEYCRIYVEVLQNRLRVL